MAAPKKLNQKGFTLIEAMILMAILAITVVTFSTWSFQRAKLMQANEYRKRTEQVVNSIKSSASQGASLSQTEELMFDDTLPTPVPSPF